MNDSQGRAGEPYWHLTLPWDRPPLMANDTGKLRAEIRTKMHVRDTVRMLARGLRIPPAPGPVVAVLSWYRATNRWADSDNIAPTLKRCLDGLRLAGVLPEDTPQHVTMTAQRVILRRDCPWSTPADLVILSLYPPAALPVAAPPATEYGRLTLGALTS